MPVKYKMNVEELVASCQFQPHYSGEDSERLWREVRNPANDRTLYDLACCLQDVEARFLAALNPGVAHRTRLLVRKQRANRQRRRMR